MIIRFKYLQSSDDALQITAMLKVTDRNITVDNVLDYLNERYPERKNIEISEIISA